MKRHPFIILYLILLVLKLSNVSECLHAKEIPLTLRVPSILELSQAEKSHRLPTRLPLGAINEWYQLKRKTPPFGRITPDDYEIFHVEFGLGRKLSGPCDADGVQWPLTSWQPHLSDEMCQIGGDIFFSGYELHFKSRYYSETIGELVQGLRIRDHAYILIVGSGSEDPTRDQETKARGALVELEVDEDGSLEKRKFGNHLWINADSESLPINLLERAAHAANVPILNFSGTLSKGGVGFRDDYILNTSSGDFSFNQILNYLGKRLGRKLSPESLRSAYSVFAEAFGYNFEPDPTNENTECQRLLVRLNEGYIGF